MYIQGLNWVGGVPPDLRSGTSCSKSTTANNRSCTSQLGSTTLHSLSLVYFSLCVMFCKKMCGHSVILHLSTLGVDRCCKRQTLFKCHKSQTECLECSKTPCRESHLCSWPFELELRPFKHQRIHRLLLSNLTTGNLR